MTVRLTSFSSASASASASGGCSRSAHTGDYHHDHCGNNPHPSRAGGGPYNNHNLDASSHSYSHSVATHITEASWREQAHWLTFRDAVHRFTVASSSAAASFSSTARARAATTAATTAASASTTTAAATSSGGRGGIAMSLRGTGTGTGTGAGTGTGGGRIGQSIPGVPMHERLPSRIVTFASAEIVTVAELAHNICRIGGDGGGRVDVGVGGDDGDDGGTGSTEPTETMDGNNERDGNGDDDGDGVEDEDGGDTCSSSNKMDGPLQCHATCRINKSVRVTGVLLHVDIVNEFILLGDTTTGSRPVPSGNGSSSGSGRVGRGSAAGGGTRRGLGGLGSGRMPGSSALLAGSKRQSLGSNGGGGGVLPPGKTPAKQTPLNRYRRTSFGGITSTSGGTSRPGSALGGGGRKPNPGGGGLLGTSTAKKRKLVYAKAGSSTPGLAAAASAAAASSSLSSSTLASGIGGSAAATPTAGTSVAAATPRPTTSLLNRKTNRKLVSTAPRATSTSGSRGLGLGLGARTPRTPSRSLTALDVIRQQRNRGCDVVAVDVSNLLPLRECKVGDMVMIIGEVRIVSPSSSLFSSHPPADNESGTGKAEANSSNTAALTTADDAAQQQHEESLLQKTLSALGTKGRVVAGRIIRNVNGTDMHLMTEALRLRRMHVKESRCWGGGGRFGAFPGLGIEGLVGGSSMVNTTVD
mmetsp:Transcript_8056/g.16796  ORF Transcript_8056/g.16796 Transcript_8056/m.16796 type:complete len:697 (-) Transcript_8056:112-2202(-)